MNFLWMVVVSSSRKCTVASDLFSFYPERCQSRAEMKTNAVVTFSEVVKYPNHSTNKNGHKEMQTDSNVPFLGNAD